MAEVDGGYNVDFCCWISENHFLKKTGLIRTHLYIEFHWVINSLLLSLSLSQCYIDSLYYFLERFGKEEGRHL